MRPKRIEDARHGVREGGGLSKVDPFRAMGLGVANLRELVGRQRRTSRDRHDGGAASSRARLTERPRRPAGAGNDHDLAAESVANAGTALPSRTEKVVAPQSLLHVATARLLKKPLSRGQRRARSSR